MYTCDARSSAVCDVMFVQEPLACVVHVSRWVLHVLIVNNVKGLLGQIWYQLHVACVLCTCFAGWGHSYAVGEVCGGSDWSAFPSILPELMVLTSAFYTIYVREGGGGGLEPTCMSDTVLGAMDTSKGSLLLHIIPYKGTELTSSSTHFTSAFLLTLHSIFTFNVLFTNVFLLTH